MTNDYHIPLLSKDEQSILHDMIDAVKEQGLERESYEFHNENGIYTVDKNGTVKNFEPWGW